MKRFLLSSLTLLLIFFSLKVSAQNYSENFESLGTKDKTPADWIVSNNTTADIYKLPNLCVDNRGLVTPSVGQSAPVRIILPATSYDASNGGLITTFKIYVFNASLKCTDLLPDFTCKPVYVKAYLVKEAFTNLTGTPAQSDIYAVQPDYQIVNANDDNSIQFSNLSITNGTRFRLMLEFKSAASGCTTSGIKFVFDDFSIKKPQTTVNPIANNDYFSENLHPLNSIKANVYGANAQWSNDLLTTTTLYSTNSSDQSPANLSGLDYDPTNPALSSMQFIQVGSYTTNKSCNNATPIIFNFYSNGTFDIDRNGNVCVSRVSFQYQVKNLITSNVSNIATVTVDFSVNAALPVHFTSFNATRKDKNVDLKWETASEENNKGFYIQRNSGGSWKDIAFVFSAAPNGNSNSNLVYTYKDANVEKGASQYRILQVDIDGKGKYSEIRSVRGEEQAAKVVVFPNPSAGKLNVLFEDAVSVRDIQVLDIAGRMVRQYVNVTSNSITIDNLRDGFYNIQVTDRHTGVSTVEKAVVKKR